MQCLDCKWWKVNPNTSMRGKCHFVPPFNWTEAKEFCSNWSQGSQKRRMAEWPWKISKPGIVVESPYGGDIEGNTAYLGRCLMDCIRRGEAPFASHGIYPSVLNEHAPEERELGITLGYTWLMRADLVAFYLDLGWSEDMKRAKEFAETYNTPCHERYLDGSKRDDL